MQCSLLREKGSFRANYAKLLELHLQELYVLGFMALCTVYFDFLVGHVTANLPPQLDQ